MQDEFGRIYGYGLCECGCGRKTSLARSGDRRRGLIKGQPLRFCLGHSTRNHTWTEEDRGHATRCWIWEGKPTPDGYGLRFVDGFNRPAHVWTYEKIHGPVPEGLELDHLCRIRLCVNPDHLEAVSHTENMRRGLSTTLTPESVRQIRAAYARGGCTYADLAAEYGVKGVTIGFVVRRASWRDVP